MTLLEALSEAHAKSGAPGRVTGFWGINIEGVGAYGARLQSGWIQRFRFQHLQDGRVRVFPSWSIAGDRQRKQATSSERVTE